MNTGSNNRTRCKLWKKVKWKTVERIKASSFGVVWKIDCNLAPAADEYDIFIVMCGTL